MDKVLNAAIEELSGVINLSTGITHPMDEARAKSLFKKLHQLGVPMDSKDVFDIAISHNWSVNHATYLSKLVKKIISGVNVRVDSHLDYEWGGNLAKKLIEKYC